MTLSDEGFAKSVGHCSGKPWTSTVPCFTAEVSKQRKVPIANFYSWKIRHLASWRGSKRWSKLPKAGKEAANGIWAQQSPSTTQFGVLRHNMAGMQFQIFPMVTLSKGPLQGWKTHIAPKSSAPLHFLNTPTCLCASSANNISRCTFNLEAVSLYSRDESFSQAVGGLQLDQICCLWTWFIHLCKRLIILHINTVFKYIPILKVLSCFHV